MVTFARNCSVNMALRLFKPLSVVIEHGVKASEKVQKILQIKKNIANAPCVL